MMAGSTRTPLENHHAAASFEVLYHYLYNEADEVRWLGHARFADSVAQDCEAWKSRMQSLLGQS